VTIRIPTNESKLEELLLLVRAHHSLWTFVTPEHDRVQQLLTEVAARLSMRLSIWSPATGLVRQRSDGSVLAGTDSLAKCLLHLADSNTEELVLFEDIGDSLRDAETVARIKHLHRLYSRHRGTIVFSGAELTVPADLEPLATPVELPIPTRAEYYHYVKAILADLANQFPIEVDLDSSGVTELLQSLSGLTYVDVHRIITRAVVDDGRLSRDDLPLVLAVKKRILERSGVLEFHPADRTMSDVAGLGGLKSWLRRRHRAFVDPAAAKAFGLDPPRGLLLIGVQGCGKSLCAKAVAAEWKLPLVRLDPGRLYSKYLGESEQNVRRALSLAEAMAPVVLWVDEIEKAVGEGRDHDGGTSERVLASFLTWLQDKRSNVFVIATANDITRMPPELLRKGRFDEIFFVDLPDARARAAILTLHLTKRGRDPHAIDLEPVVAATDGFNGAELEQLVVSGLYAVFADGGDLDAARLVAEARATRPLSVTMDEPIARVRAWAKDRAVMADAETPEPR